MIIDGNVGNLVQETSNLRIGFKQLLCVDNLYKEEAAKEDEKVNTIDEKKIISYDKVKSFQNKYWFLLESDNN